MPQLPGAGPDLDDRAPWVERKSFEGVGNDRRQQIDERFAALPQQDQRVE